MTPTNEELNAVVFGVISTQLGWCGAGGRSLPDVARLAARDGDHVEIGSLFGASARVAAGVKTKYEYTGTVYCIDPMEFDSHEACIRLEGNDSQKMMLREQFQIFSDATKAYGDRIRLIRKPSYPWPLEDDQRFVTAFIDGWHYGDGPLNDAKKLVDVVSEMILLDDVVPGYPDVYKAFQYLCSCPRWFLTGKTERCAVFMRGEAQEIFTEEGKRPGPGARDNADEPEQSTV